MRPPPFIPPPTNEEKRNNLSRELFIAAMAGMADKTLALNTERLNIQINDICHFQYPEDENDRGQRAQIKKLRSSVSEKGHRIGDAIMKLTNYIMQTKLKPEDHKILTQIGIDLAGGE